MKKSEYIKDLQLTIKAISEELNNEVGDFVKKIDKEQNNKLVDVKINLIQCICKGEKLNFIEMCDKYLTPSEKKRATEQMPIMNVSRENLLDTIEINGVTYFFENKEKGIIYNKKTNNRIGMIIEGKPVFD